MYSAKAVLKYWFYFRLVHLSFYVLSIENISPYLKLVPDSLEKVITLQSNLNYTNSFLPNWRQIWDIIIRLYFKDLDPIGHDTQSNLAICPLSKVKVGSSQTQYTIQPSPRHF